MIAGMGATGPDIPELRGDQPIKVWFRFVPRQDWPPYDTEGLWATPITADTARIDNVPFMQDGLALGDEVRYVTDAGGRKWAAGRVDTLGNCTVRIIPVPDGPLEGSAEVHERLRPFGIVGETFSTEFPMVALNIPATANLKAIKKLLAKGHEQGWWYYEVSCLTDAWRKA